MAVDKSNRIKLLAGACVAWSLTSIATGSFDSLLILGIMRFLLGFAQSVHKPAMYSIIADYFPENKISTINGLLVTGSYLGASCSSLSIMLTARFGWRNTFNIMGAFGILIGLLGLIFVKEPLRGQ